MARKKPDIEAYRVPVNGEFHLSSVATDDDQGMDKEDARERLSRNQKLMNEYQERLYAEGKQALLIVLQAKDTGGKDSTIRRVAGVLNPQGCHVTGFKAPTDEELAHDFLWRIHDHVPAKGQIGIFNRSHYEDVLVVRVHELAPPDLIERRYAHINDFERLLFDHGVRVVKVMLHISKEYQLKRLRRRLERPDKHWKFNPGDLDERKLWDDYMDSFEIALNRCSTEQAPWYVVPAEKRWFRDALVSEILVETLSDMDPRYPEPDFDLTRYTPESIS